MAGKSSMEPVMVRLPPKLASDLKAAAKESGLGERGLAEEIRRRLEESLRAKDRETRYLAALVVNLTGQVTDYLGHWNREPYAHEVLRLGLERLMDMTKPDGEVAPKFNPNSIADVLFDPDAGPEPIARALAISAWNATPNIIRLRDEDGHENS